MSSPSPVSAPLPGETSAGGSSLRQLRRLLRDVLPADAQAPDGAPPLELHADHADPPRCVGVATLLEGHGFRSRRVTGEPAGEIAAFLDGAQRSHVVAHVGGAPIVHGTVGAVVRERRNRRFVTWRRGPVVRSRLYAPRAALDASLWAKLRAVAGDALVDTTEPAEGPYRDRADVNVRHPFALADLAYHLVQRDRERAEQELAERWCADGAGVLYVDGGIARSDVVAAAPCVVGVVKSHRTLYVDGPDLDLVLALRRGERTTAFSIETQRRAAVASWYLRVREPRGGDPLFGLVRLEAAREGDGEMGERLDELSRLVMAEAAPLALPDARWDVMAYGIRDCEQLLRAVM